MQIKTINSISISEFWEGVRVHDVALRQGDLDGACGPYSLMMVLILLDVLTKNKAEKIWNGEVDGRKKFAKFIRQLDALISTGLTDDQLKELFCGIQELIGTQKIKSLEMINIEPMLGKKSVKGTAFLNAVQMHIDDYDRPVILSLDWSKNDAHYVVAVGYQLNKKGELAHILTMDPGSSTGPVCAWNGVLGQGAINSKKLHYATNDGNINTCTVSSVIGFRTKQKT